MSVLVSAAVPARWTLRRFDRCFARSQQAGRPDSEPLSVYLGAGVVPRASRGDNYNKLGADLGRYLVVRPGDLVFNKLRTWQGGFGCSNHRGIVSPAYFVCRPVRDVYPRFVDHLLHSSPYLAELARISKWQPPSQFDTPWEQLRLLPLMFPTLAHQQGIADFLDRECARIAGVIAVSERAVSVLAEQRRETFDRLVVGVPTTPLRYLIAGVDQGWSPECEASLADPGEWGVLKVGCVNYGTFRPEEHKRLPDDLVPRPAIEAHVGDVLVSRSNTRELVGSAAVVHDLSGRRLMLCDLLYRLHLTPRLRAVFLAEALNSRASRRFIQAVASGAAGSMPKISQAMLRSLRVPDLPTEDQLRIEREVIAQTTRIDHAQAALAELQGRLAEYRTALITEAVTGQLDVTAVSGTQMDERVHAAAEGAVAAHQKATRVG